MEVGRIAAGSSRPTRLDPFSLPVRFEAADEAADERLCIIDLHRERLLRRRCVRGMPMALNLPLSAFRGIAIRLSGKPDESPSSIAIVLEHGDPALSLPLFSSPEIDDIVEEWQSWGRALGLPLLVRTATAACASRSRGSARCAVKRPPGAGGVAAPWPGVGRSGCCAAALVPLLQHRSFIGASARSSRGIDAPTGYCSSEQRERRASLR